MKQLTSVFQMLNTNPVKQPGFLTITEVPLIGEKTLRGSAILRMVKLMGHGMKMLVGMPDYDNYVQHMQERHPELPVMSYETFFRERQQARYGGDGKGGGMRCC